MKETKTFGAMLFKTLKQDIEITRTDVQISSTSSTAKKSSYRPTGVSGNPKASNLALGVQRLLREASVLQGKNLVYVEYESSADGTAVGITFNGNEFKCTTVPSILGMLTALTAYCSRESSDLDEVKEIYEDLASSYQQDGEIESDSLYSFCDSVYYGFAKEKVNVDISDELIPVEIQMMINNEGLKAFGVNENFSLVAFKSETTTENGLPASQSEMYEEMKRGEWKLPYEWDAESAAYIPQLSALEKYHPTQMFFDIATQLRYSLFKTIEKIDSGTQLQQELMEYVVNAVLTGEPGTGKTILLYSLAAALQIPCYTIALDAKTEGDEFKGMIKVDGETGKLHFEDTDFLRGFTKGGIVILEEVNLLDPNLAQGVLGQALEYPYVVFKDGNQKVHRSPLCAVYSTMNTDTNGSMNLNQAFASRSPSVYVLDAVTKEDFVRALVAKFGNRFSLAQGEWAYKVWETTHEYLKKPDVQADDIALVVSQRSCYELLKQIEITKNARSAIKNTFFGSVFLYDKDVAYTLLELLDSKIGVFPAN